MYNVSLCSTGLYSRVYAMYVFFYNFDDWQDSLNMVPTELKQVRVWHNVDDWGCSFLAYSMFCWLVH